MRHLGILVLLLGAGCQQQEQAPAKPAEITFDGARANDAAALRAHGERLTHVLGCTGCHGAHLEGDLFTKGHPEWGPLYASNLTVEVPEYTDAQLDGIIRRGVHPARKAVWGMPSQIFHNLTNADLNALIFYLRSLKPIGRKTPPPRFSVQDKKDIASGLYRPAADLVAVFKHTQPIDLGSTHALGRYIASVTCEECHGSSLQGDPMSKTPNLIIAGGYSRAEFVRLITHGIPTGGRKLNPIMSGVATTRFAHLTSHERDALYAYLKARAERAE
jgi:cytochrome c553